MAEESIPELSPEERLARKKEETRLYNQAWQAAHPGYSRRKSKQWREQHPGYTQQYGEKYNQEHREEQRARARAYARAHRLEKSIYYKKWLANNRDKDRARSRRRRARRKAVAINDFTLEQWRALCKTVGYRCCYCGKKFPFDKLEPDHLTPYAKQGNNTLQNILPACEFCNSRKKDRNVLRPVQPFLLLDDSAAD
jgi:5-methylcytosine-specific restriction endonuclease McrA